MNLFGHLRRSSVAERQVLLVVIAATVSSAAFAEPYVNLLVNGDLAGGASVPGWQFVGNGARRVDKGVATDPSVGRYLLIKSSPGERVQCWWSQLVPVRANVRYQGSVTARGFATSDGADHIIDAGVYFLDAGGKWLGYKQVASVAERQAQWPASTKPDVRSWTKYDFSVTVPSGTVTMGVRLNLSGSPAEADFARLALWQTSSAVQILNALPPTLPSFTANLTPVSASGVTLTPSWTIADAAQTSSTTRHTVCLNGLWAVEPSDTTGTIGEAGAPGWAFVKVPGRVRGQPRSFFYGQDQTVWAKQNLLVPSFWLWREVTLPSWTGQFYIDFAQVTGAVARAYWNGRPIGIVNDYWGARLQLPPDAHAGDKGQLAVFVLCNSTFDNSTAHLIAAGNADRSYSFEANQRPWCSELGDVFLRCDPVKPAFGEMRISTSVRKHELSVALDNAAAPTGSVWKVLVRTSNGATVFDLPVAAATAGTRQRLSVPWSNPHLWNPDDPFLYTLQISLVDRHGQIIDESLPQRFGFREVWVDGKHLKLNGQTLRLRPRMSYSIFNSDLGSARRAFAFLKTMGFNCIIRSPAMQNEEDESAFYDEYYDIADEMGMMMVCYTPYGLVTGGQFGASQTSVNDTLMKYIDTRLVARTVNHASVIAYAGFGPGLTVDGNPYNANPKWFGVKPLDNFEIMEDLAKHYNLAKVVVEASGNDALAFVHGVKTLATDRPFLSHYDAGQADGWGTFDYFNWTPVQEWESWIAPWAANGVKPIGAWEHGLPYPASFANHGIPDGDNEPWVTEYAAAELGPVAYRSESESYRNSIRDMYTRNKPAYGDFRSYDIAAYDNVQTIWAAHNARIYRSWRTYGVPMGIEPFGAADSYVKLDVLRRDNAKVLASEGQQLKTPGFKPDTWHNDWNWLNETAPSLESFTTDNLTPFGQALYANNRELLAYIAGSQDNFASKAHVYSSGEQIEKQVALIWDGFAPRSLTIEIVAMQQGAVVFSKTYPVTLSAGEIRMLRFKFPAPTVAERTPGQISLTVTDSETHVPLAQDRFAYSVLPTEPHSLPWQSERIAVFDPTGDSRAMLARLGLNPISITPGQPLPPRLDLMVIGRSALEAVRGTRLIASLPDGVPVLVLEQTDTALERLGFHAFPARIREVWKPLGTTGFLSDLTDDELRDWRVCPHLLPSSPEALRPGYNCHGTYDGVVASVAIETPTAGNFTPLLQCGFDLAMTPLLEAIWQGHKTLFCQLSLPDGVGSDPVATRVAGEILNYLARGAADLHDLAVVGDDATIALARTVGADVKCATSPSDLQAGQIALIGKLGTQSMSALKAWVGAGGTAVVMPQEIETYGALDPHLQPTIKSSSYEVPVSAGNVELLEGLGVNDFHTRQNVDWVEFSGSGPVAQIQDGSGRWILLGFDPRQFSAVDKPYLRLSYRRQCRCLSQILTNAGARLGTPVSAVLGAIDLAPFSLDLTQSATRRESVHKPDGDWTMLTFDDSKWRSFSLGSAGASDAWLRMTFDVAASKANRTLTLDAGTFDDYDETYINGVLVGSVSPQNSTPDTAWMTRRIYSIPASLINAGRNDLAIHTWNRGSALGHPAIIRGPLVLRDSVLPSSPYAGTYKHSDDPYLQHHW